MQVVILQLLETAHLFAVSAVLWQMTIVAMDDPSTLLILSNAEVALMLLTIWMEFVSQASATHVVIVALTHTPQTFFLYRLWLISSAKIPTLFGVVLSILSQVTGYLSMAKFFTVREVLQYEAETRTTLILTFTTKVACDVWIASCIAIYLWSKRRSSGFSKTRRSLDTLILWSVETGMCTSVIGLLVLALFLSEGTTSIWIGVFLVSGSIYANTIMAA
ncbi:hypothetical protein CONPUDRAFT_155378 [Coniophora puteana RWD-64-598 SS2]|uniref:DUF6534 domain-containing protein n=1 Tax=Coniophora puteana (strain RWD-64-598) TaxID=741705 RepID=A0A5M3MLW9_CONPW|nr:uncharacterized protein CONPUDRAFT_155378 [Coniophora puteana RWD-64-598 SS2]EIW80000.1 hypothetical protein CONPUDRAFT_155378 [Coniophora puteana RWD-64-598 SS2]